MLNPLLVQLFGREVVDRLEKAGLATDQSVAQLNSDELSRRTGLTPDIAQRVAALAAESCVSSRPRRARRTKAARPNSSKPEARTKRRKSEQPAPSDRLAPPARAVALSGSTDLADEENPETLAESQTSEDNTVFVDEAGLIAWMGFASRTGAEGSLLSSIADGILEPSDPHQPAASQSPSSSPSPSSAVTLEGSFWNFGNRPHRGVTVSLESSDTLRSERADDEPKGSGKQPLRPVPFHRRRSHDGH